MVGTAQEIWTKIELFYSTVYLKRSFENSDYSIIEESHDFMPNITIYFPCISGNDKIKLMKEMNGGL